MLELLGDRGAHRFACTNDAAPLLKFHINLSRATSRDQQGYKQEAHMQELQR